MAEQERVELRPAAARPNGIGRVGRLLSLAGLGAVAVMFLMRPG